MKARSTCLYALAALLGGFLGATTTLAAGLDDSLVAHWTFESEDQMSKVGMATLTASGVGADQTSHFDDGKLVLGKGRLMTSGEINSLDIKGLTQSATLWVRLRLETLPEQTTFLFGLRNQEAPGNWEHMILCLLYNVDPTIDSKGLSAYSTGQGTQQLLATPPSRAIEVEAGQFLNVAIVFDGAQNSLTLYVNGEAVSKTNASVFELADFNNFSVGRLKEAGGTPLTIDEIRIYSVALSPEWLEEIAAPPAP